MCVCVCASPPHMNTCSTYVCTYATHTYIYAIMHVAWCHPNPFESLNLCMHHCTMHPLTRWQNCFLSDSISLELYWRIGNVLSCMYVRECMCVFLCKHHTQQPAPVPCGATSLHTTPCQWGLTKPNTITGRYRHAWTETNMYMYVHTYLQTHTNIHVRVQLAIRLDRYLPLPPPYYDGFCTDNTLLQPVQCHHHYQQQQAQQQLTHCCASMYRDKTGREALGSSSLRIVMMPNSLHTTSSSTYRTSSASPPTACYNGLAAGASPLWQHKQTNTQTSHSLTHVTSSRFSCNLEEITHQWWSSH